MNFEKIRDVGTRFIEFLANNKYITAIKNGMMTYVPFTIIGTFALVIACFPSDAYIAFMCKILNDPNGAWIGKVISLMDGSMNIASMLCTLFVAYNLSVTYKEKVSPIIPAVLSLCIYVQLTCLTATEAGTAILISKFGASNLIVAILLGLLVPTLFYYLVRKKLTIKLPDSVPPAVSESFSSLIPIVLVFLAGFVVKELVGLTPYEDIHVLISTVIGKPLVNIGGSVYGFALAIGIMALLWACGIHGTSIIITGILGPVLMMTSDANRLAFIAGEPIPNIITNDFYSFMCNNIISLYLCVFLFAKSRSMREVAKVGIVPGLFNMGEPAVFGFPIMFNPYLAVPYILTSVVGVFLTYAVQSMGLVAKCVIAAPWTMPYPLFGLISTGGKISGAIWELVLIVVYAVIWFPFVKGYDKRMLKEEAEETEE